VGRRISIGFDILTEVVVKTSVSCDMTSCPPLKVNQISEERVDPETLLAIFLHASFLLGLFFVPEDGGNMFLRNVG
jgi:hypothetical protein